MRQRGLGHLEHAEDIGAEGLLPLLFADVFQAFLRMLFGRVIDQNVELAELGPRLVDNLAADFAIGHIAGEGQALAALLFDHAAGFVSVLVLIEIENRHIGAFASEQHRHRAANTAVAAGDDCNLALQFAGRLVVFALELRARIHQAFFAGFGLFLWR